MPEVTIRTRRPGRPNLRDAATLCRDVLDVPGHPLVCELDAGHLELGVKHKSGCTLWGTPTNVEP